MQGYGSWHVDDMQHNRRMKHHWLLTSVTAGPLGAVLGPNNPCMANMLAFAAALTHKLTAFGPTLPVTLAADEIAMGALCSQPPRPWLPICWCALFVQIKTSLVLSGDKGVVTMLSSLFPDGEEVAGGEQERWEAADPC